MTYQMTDEHKARIRQGIARKVAEKQGKDPDVAAEEALNRPEGPAVVRFSREMIDAWLLARFRRDYPNLTTRIASMCMSNDYLFIANGEAVFCALCVNDGVPLVVERFAYARTNPERLIQLYKYARDWARSLKAEGLVVGIHSDLPMSEFGRYFKIDPAFIIR